MAESSSTQKLLLANNGGDEAATSVRKNGNLFVGALRWVLKIAMWAAFIAWLLLIFMYPLQSVNALIDTWTQASAQTFLGFTGCVFVIFNGPIMLIALLSVVYLCLTSMDEELQLRSRGKKPSYRLWTLPVMVEGPFGVVSAAEMIGILCFAVYLIWVAGVYAVQKFPVILENADYTTEVKWSWLFRSAGRAFGLSGAFCLSFLFIPVARGSVILRVVNIAPEHAIRYHVWLGNLTILLLTSHGLFYFIGWIMAGEIPSELITWTCINGANLAGIINIFFGWSIWVTSLPFVRRKNFELFYYTHHLYIIFIIFFAMHVGNFFFNIAAGSMFLFMLDRFLRFCQSRKTVDVVSASCFSCGAVELMFSMPANLGYNALSFLSLSVREISPLQWHPFSVTSSPLDGKDCVTVLIKAVGNWTSNLKDNVEKFSEVNQARHAPSFHLPKITASVEGPYGHQFPYYLTYENLVLVAGGIGISPFIAIFSDIFHRIKQGKPCPPTRIFFVWAVKTSDELSLLSTINIDSVQPFPFDKLHIELLIHVTQEENDVLRNSISCSAYNVLNESGISALVSTGNKIWSGAYITSSTIGLITIISLLNIFYITPFEITNWWYQGLLLVACMVASVVIFGGAVVCLWKAWEERKLAKEKNNNHRENIDFDAESNNENAVNQNLFLENLASSTTIHYGSRPDFKEIFGTISKLWGHVDVGVIVCGPPPLQSSVARECRSQNINRESDDPIFHFNSHSFSF